MLMTDITAQSTSPNSPKPAGCSIDRIELVALVASDHIHALKVAQCEAQILADMPITNTAESMSVCVRIIKAANIDALIASGASPDAVASDVISRCKAAVESEQTSADSHRDESARRRKADKKRSKQRRVYIHSMRNVTPQAYLANQAAIEAEIHNIQIGELSDNAVFNGETGLWEVVVGDGALYITLDETQCYSNDGMVDSVMSLPQMAHHLHAKSAKHALPSPNDIFALYALQVGMEGKGMAALFA